MQWITQSLWAWTVRTLSLKVEVPANRVYSLSHTGQCIPASHAQAQYGNCPAFAMKTSQTFFIQANQRWQVLSVLLKSNNGTEVTSHSYSKMIVLEVTVSWPYRCYPQWLTAPEKTHTHKRETKQNKKVFLVHFSTNRLRPFQLMEGLSKCKLYE